MDYSAVFLDKAQAEVLNVWEWYEDRQVGLGDRFKQYLFGKINTILLNPELYECKFKQYREAKINVFPYLIIYKIDKVKKLIIIISIFHTSRKISTKY